MNQDIRKLLSDPRKLSQALRSLPARVPPHGFTTSLRVVASRERVRPSPRERLVYWLENARFTLNNLMRPFAVPAAAQVAGYAGTEFVEAVRKSDGGWNPPDRRLGWSERDAFPSLQRNDRSAPCLGAPPIEIGWP